MNNKRGLALHWKILIALFFGVMAGYLSGDFTIWGTPLVSVYEFIGQLFLNALKMLIVPLIASSIALGVAGLGNTDSLGSMGFKTALVYVLTSTTAIVTGLIIVNLVQPGMADGQPVGELLALTGNADEIQTRPGGNSTDVAAGRAAEHPGCRSRQRNVGTDIFQRRIRLFHVANRTRTG
jgi:L-cystine uptake protein TcyP (sodium:dicarboxylate symporter family)